MPQGPNIENDPYLGLEIASALKLEALIGVGTTGRVYRAIQGAIGSTFAVKILHRFLMQTPGVKERFHREARLLGRLIHPGIVRIIGSGELPVLSPDQGGETFLIYEYLQGTTLRERLRSNPPIDSNEAVSIVLQIAEAVAAAHQRKIIHRDLKPENLMSVRRDNEEARYVVLDFGLSRALDAEPDPITRAGAILGTPQYMSPEAARGNTGTEASDVYALATILYELLAGHPPFCEGTAIAVLAQQAASPPPRFARTLNIAPTLEEFILSNLAKEPNLRCPNGSHFRTGLQQALAQGTLTTSSCLNAPSSAPAPSASQMKPLVSK